MASVSQQKILKKFHNFLKAFRVDLNACLHDTPIFLSLIYAIKQPFTHTLSTDKLFTNKITDSNFILATTHFTIFPLQLSLRTVNSGRSAYACFTFCPSFFHHYDDGKSQLKNTTCTTSSQTNTIKCKVPVKVSHPSYFTYLNIQLSV